MINFYYALYLVHVDGCRCPSRATRQWYTYQHQPEETNPRWQLNMDRVIKELGWVVVKGRVIVN